MNYEIQAKERALKEEDYILQWEIDDNRRNKSKEIQFGVNKLSKILRGKVSAKGDKNKSRKLIDVLLKINTEGYNQRKLCI